MSDNEQYALPALGYGYADLEPVISKETLELHHDAHHAAYVSGANKALSDLASARRDGVYSTINQMQKDLAFNLSGHILHSIFWCNMSPRGGGAPQGRLAQAVSAAFGSDDNLREQMSHAATGIQGSGWAALCYEPLSKQLIVEQIFDHQGNLGSGSIPLLVLDMWEHAYYLAYRNKKASWVERFWDIVDWEDVGRRYESAQPVDLSLAA